jgi:hypothetical protein
MWYYLMANAPNEFNWSKKELKPGTKKLFQHTNKKFMELNNKIFELENRIKELEYAPSGTYYQEAYQDFVCRINN